MTGISKMLILKKLEEDKKKQEKLSSVQRLLGRLGLWKC